MNINSNLELKKDEPSPDGSVMNNTKSNNVNDTDVDLDMDVGDDEENMSTVSNQKETVISTMAMVTIPSQKKVSVAAPLYHSTVPPQSVSAASLYGIVPVKKKVSVTARRSSIEAWMRTQNTTSGTFPSAMESFLPGTVPPALGPARASTVVSRAGLPSMNGLQSSAYGGPFPGISPTGIPISIDQVFATNGIPGSTGSGFGTHRPSSGQASVPRLLQLPAIAGGEPASSATTSTDNDGKSIPIRVNSNGTVCMPKKGFVHILRSAAAIRQEKKEIQELQEKKEMLQKTLEYATRRVATLELELQGVRGAATLDDINQTQGQIDQLQLQLQLQLQNTLKYTASNDAELETLKNQVQDALSHLEQARSETRLEDGRLQELKIRTQALTEELMWARTKGLIRRQYNYMTTLKDYVRR